VLLKICCLLGAYHKGINLGYNYLQSTNYATRDWISLGACAGFSTTLQNPVKLDRKTWKVLANIAAANDSIIDEGNYYAS
jgi:hypothetical protein